MDVTQPASTASPFGLSTTPVGSLDWDYEDHYYTLREFLYLPPPESPIIVPPSTHLGIALSSTTLTSIGIQCVWEETGV
jgi:hypothetical protein